MTIRAAVTRGGCVSAPPGMHYASSHYRGPTLYCHFWWRRSLGLCLHWMEKAMSLTVTLHSPFPPPPKMYLGGFRHKLLMRTLQQWQSFYPAVQKERQRQKSRNKGKRGVKISAVINRLSTKSGARYFPQD